MNGQYAALLIAIPLISAFFVPLIKRTGRKAILSYVMAVTIAQIAVASWVFRRVYTTGKPIIVMAGGWKPPVGINLYIGYFAALFVLIVAIASFLMAVFNLRAMKTEPLDKYAMLFLLLMLGATGMITTGDIFNLFVFMEITSITAYALVAYNKTGEAAEASMKYMILGGIGSSFFLIGIALIYGATGTLNMAQLAQFAGLVNSTVVQAALALLIFGLAVEAEIFPLNAWAPDAYQASPHPITAMFAAFVVKAGLYAMVRILFLFQASSSWSGVMKLLVVMATLTVIFGEFSALRQRDVKRMVAYSSISQIGLAAFGFALVGKAGVSTSVASLAVSAAVFHMLNHAIVKLLLFLAVGYVAIALGGTKLENFKGLGRRMPVTAFSITIAAFAVVGVPMFNVFWSKVKLLIAGVEAGYTWSVFLILGASVVEAVYYFRLVHTMWFREGRRKEGSERNEGSEAEGIKESVPIVVMMLALVAVIIYIGLYPNTVWHVVQKAGSDLLNVGSYVKHVPLINVGVRP